MSKSVTFSNYQAAGPLALQLNLFPTPGNNYNLRKCVGFFHFAALSVCSVSYLWAFAGFQFPQIKETRMKPAKQTLFHEWEVLLAGITGIRSSFVKGQCQIASNSSSTKIFQVTWFSFPKIRFNESTHVDIILHFIQ